MKFSSIFAVGSVLLSSFSLAAPGLGNTLSAVTGSGSNAPSLSASDASAMLKELQSKLEVSEKKIDSTLAGVSKDSSSSDKSAALAKISPLLSQMAVDISNTTGMASYKAAGAKSSSTAVAQRDDILGDLGVSLRVLLTGLGLSLESLIETLGLVPTVYLLTPVTGAVAGLIHTLEPLVDGLLPELEPLLKPVLDGVANIFEVLGFPLDTSTHPASR